MWLLTDGRIRQLAAHLGLITSTTIGSASFKKQGFPCRLGLVIDCTKTVPPPTRS